MELVKSDFNSRCSDIMVLYKHIELISSHQGTVKICSILKASVFIALYNNVEATFYSIFEKVHNEINVIHYDFLERNVQKIIKSFYFGGTDVSDSDCCELKFPLLKDFLRKSTLFSGNLDSRKGRALFKKYGIDFDNQFDKAKLYSLLIIKDKRNRIAHGELSFPDVGKVISYQQLLIIINNSTEVLREFIHSAEVFLAMKKYQNKNDG